MKATQRYPVLIYPTGKGGFCAHFPDFETIEVHARTTIGALGKAREALRARVEALQAAGDVLPFPLDKQTAMSIAGDLGASLLLHVAVEVEM
jgi:predicted RNase H-like HicB family nuclease